MPAALEPMARKLTKKLREARRGDPDGVHDGRTLLRRIRVALGVMAGAAFEPARAETLARSLRDVERALGATRDDDAFLEELGPWSERLGDAEKAEAAPLLERVRARRSKHGRAASRALESKRARRALRELASFVEDPGSRALPHPGNPARAARSLVQHFVHDAVWRAYEEVLAYDGRREHDVEVIHKFRSACRRLRFTLELFDGAIRGSASVAEPLHALQTRLGQLHDHALAVARVRKWLANGRLPRTAAIRRYVAAREQARDRLAGEYDAERSAVMSQGFRLALFDALNAGAARVPHGALRLVPAA